jgi:acetamidase/formamidase
VSQSHARRGAAAAVVLTAALVAACAPRAVRVSPSTATGSSDGGSVHTLLASPSTVAWGYYDAAATPVLRVNSGDQVEIGTVSTCSPRSLLRAGLDSSQIEQNVKDIYAARSTLHPGPGGHILTGPIYVTGADSGDVLEVDIERIDLAIPYACNSFGPRSGFLPEDFGHSKTRIIQLDAKSMMGHFAPGIDIPLHPFFGSMGVAPPASWGRVNSAPPGPHAGNLDNKELVAGTKLYIPVWTRGALLEVGDGHAGQGNGEVDITAMETSLRGRLRLVVRKDMHLTWPLGETPTHWIAMGTDTSLVRATKTAVRQAIAFLTTQKGMTADDAYQLVSVAGDVDITQLVDGNVGVHVMIPKAIFH